VPSQAGGVLPRGGVDGRVDDGDIADDAVALPGTEVDGTEVDGVGEAAGPPAHPASATSIPAAATAARTMRRG
jgi:hypothetical protein